MQLMKNAGLTAQCSSTALHHSIKTRHSRAISWHLCENNTCMSLHPILIHCSLPSSFLCGSCQQASTPPLKTRLPTDTHRWEYKQFGYLFCCFDHCWLLGGKFFFLRHIISQPELSYFPEKRCFGQFLPTCRTGNGESENTAVEQYLLSFCCSFISTRTCSH